MMLMMMMKHVYPNCDVYSILNLASSGLTAPAFTVL